VLPSAAAHVGARAGDLAEGPEEAAADLDGGGDAGDPRCLLPATGPLLLRCPSRGCRAGEALGLRHEDIAAAECEITVVPRGNANGARAKSGGRTVPVGPELIRLYSDYLHAEYGGIDSSYVFVNLFAEPRGHAWSYPAIYDLVLRLRAKTGIDFDRTGSGIRRPRGCWTEARGGGLVLRRMPPRCPPRGLLPATRGPVAGLLAMASIRNPDGHCLDLSRCDQK
jgi:hypothetical protein